MSIDIIFVLLLIIGCIRGYQKGLIVSLFSVIAFIIGLAAALKLSAVVAAKLSAGTNVSAKWLPLISFILVFLIVVILVNLAARMLQKSVEMFLLGWVNRLGGIIFFALLYGIIFSIFLFYAVHLHVIKVDTMNSSVCYPYLKPLAPVVIDKLGLVIPFFKDMFSNLEHFFDAVSNKI